jgi:hypothetical protein
LYPSVDASGQLSGIVPFSIKMEDKWTMVSFLSLGGSIKKSVNVENLTKQSYHTQQKPIAYGIIDGIKTGNILNNKLSSLFDCFQTLCHLKKLLPDDSFHIRNNVGSIVTKRL